MKKKLVLIALVAVSVGSIFFNASAGGSNGSLTEYYSDATYSKVVGMRGWGLCAGRYGIISAYSITEPCIP